MKETPATIREIYPEFPLPPWIPEAVVDFVHKHAESVETLKGHDLPEFASYDANVRYLKRALVVLKDETTRDMWELLNDKSPDVAVELVWLLTAIEYNAGLHMKIHKRNKEAQKAHLKIIENAEKLYNLLQGFNNSFPGDLSFGDTRSLEIVLQDFVITEKAKNGEYKKVIGNVNYLSSRLILLSRELNSEKAMPLRFLKMISLFFRLEFGKPYHKYTTQIVSLVFDVHYDENTATKITENIINYLKPEDSPI